MLAPTLIRQIKCSHCRRKFFPEREAQEVCSDTCAEKKVKKLRKEQKAAERLADKQKREDQKTLPKLKKEAQDQFNRYVRLRDAGKPCICCGAPLGFGEVGGGYDAGHFRSVGTAPNLRYDERNVHAQRKYCNRRLAGRAVEYRIGLIERIGLEAVEALEADNSVRKYTREELAEIRDTYRKRANELEKERA
jgi:hypothetical protein